jgi:hypothetical protein
MKSMTVHNRSYSVVLRMEPIVLRMESTNHKCKFPSGIRTDWISIPPIKLIAEERVKIWCHLL